MLVSVNLSLGKSSQIYIIISHHISASIVNILLTIKFRWEGDGSWSIILMKESCSWSKQGKALCQRLLHFRDDDPTTKPSFRRVWQSFIRKELAFPETCLFFLTWRLWKYAISNFSGDCFVDLYSHLWIATLKEYCQSQVFKIIELRFLSHRFDFALWGLEGLVY